MTKDPAKRCEFQYCNPIDCNGHGECSAKARKCVCKMGWTGPGCGMALCPKNCNNNGLCRPIAGQKNMGVCDCNKGFSGKHCEIQYCGVGNDCSKHGTCNHETQACECAVGFNGPHCNNTYCGPQANCNNHGFCNQKNAKCDCHPGFAGELCADTYCPPSCSVHGRCDHEAKKCRCNKNWAGLGCDQWTGTGEPPKQKEEHEGPIPLVETRDHNLTKNVMSDAMMRAVDDTTVQLFEKFTTKAAQVSEEATRAADGNYAVAKKFGDTLMATSADLILQECDYKCELNTIDGDHINNVLKDVVDAEVLLSADMDRKRVKISLLQMMLQKLLGFASSGRIKKPSIAALAYKEYELSFKSAKNLSKGVTLMEETAKYKAKAVQEGMLTVMALAQADLQIGKARTIIEEVLLKKLAQKEFPTLGDEVAKEFASRAPRLANVDPESPLTTELMKKAESSMTTLITTAKAHSFYRGNDDGAPEVEDAEAAFHQLVNSGGDQKPTMALEAMRQAKEVKGKNITRRGPRSFKSNQGQLQITFEGWAFKVVTRHPNNCMDMANVLKGYATVILASLAVKIVKNQ